MVTDKNAKGSEFDTWGGSFSCFSVSAKSKVLKDAAEFAKYVTLQQNKYAFINGTNLPCYRVDVSPDQVKSDINKQVIKLMDKSTSFTIGWDLMLEQKNAQEYMDNITKLLGGALTPEQFVATLPK
jgi:raffinose/stachyose/melibiose transport system substrate-binding protein